MSRIGNRPIQLASGVSVSLKGEQVEVKGPKGTLSNRLPSAIQVSVGDGSVSLTRPDGNKKTRALHGLARALLANMVTGVTDGFTKELTIIGVGYRAEAAGKSLKLLLGFSHPVELAVPEGLKVSVTENTKIKIEGADKGRVGQFASEVRALRPPEPYKGKGVRYVDEQVRRKVGKAAVG
ncbi:MAG: 50S ribosomal protein L6 [Deltaproteobacteria bacterium]|nr:50S ribosomal protein L6 [Deltaproteobacteria bacterium]MBW2395587.1 50S ribosomal protein L6 [Deltaproteobacteria bacterium]